jgi:uncharacterized membrane protein
MTTARLEAFTDGVIAILITILVLELRVPQGAGLDALRPLFPVFLVYVLSFVNLGLYWNKHHHMLAVTDRVNGRIMWANLFLLFWLSLFPFATGWMGENHFAALPTAFYGVVGVMAAVSYTLLQQAIIADQGAHSKLATAIRGDFKGKLSLALYVIAIPLAFWNQWVSDALYVSVAIMWFVPDRRIERRLKA